MSTKKTESRFPTEIVDLPSKGLLYPEGHPLSEGKVEVKYMTAKEEDILTSMNLIEKGIVIDELLKSLIITKFDYGDLLIGDKNAIMLSARILGYGKDYQVEVTCGACGEKEDTPFDLTGYPYKEVDESQFNSDNQFKFKLPNSEREVEFKLLTHADEHAITEELDRMKKAGMQATGEITTRLRYQLLSVDGNTDKEFINNFINNEFFALDSRAFREHVVSITPDVDFTSYFICESCKNTDEIQLPITANFFWPSR
tara:strand:+ start:1168 stop:1935 length:768 start_codon:yes stop_codon:yes gene_type:complete